MLVFTVSHLHHYLKITFFSSTIFVPSLLHNDAFLVRSVRKFKVSNISFFKFEVNFGSKLTHFYPIFEQNFGFCISVSCTTILSIFNTIFCTLLFVLLVSQKASKHDFRQMQFFETMLQLGHFSQIIFRLSLCKKSQIFMHAF